MTNVKVKKQETGIAIKQDMLENQAKIVYLALGSNLGNKRKNIELAKFKIQTNKIEIVKSSNNYETLSWPNKRNPKFINVVLEARTFLSPYDLLKTCRIIEKELGRKTSNKNEPRTCDIDIIDYDQKIIRNNSNQNLTLPHPEMHVRSFVLLPLFEITHKWIHPEKKIEIKKLINLLDIKDLRTIKQI